MLEQWGKLTGDDLDVAAGRRDQIVRKVQERYGVAKDEAGHQRKEFEERYEAVTKHRTGGTPDSWCRQRRLVLAGARFQMREQAGGHYRGPKGLRRTPYAKTARVAAAINDWPNDLKSPYGRFRACASWR